MNVKPAADWNPAAAPTFWINHASRLIQRTFEQRLRKLGFGMAYIPVLMALEEHGPLTQKELLARAHVEQPTMAALLARMARDGVIARYSHPDDQRAKLISLTPKARARLPKAREHLREGAQQATAGLSEVERATLLALLQRVVRNLGGRSTTEAHDDGADG